MRSNSRKDACDFRAQAKFIVRYHSFYALHKHGAYEHLLNDDDRALLPWLKRFQVCASERYDAGEGAGVTRRLTKCCV